MATNDQVTIDIPPQIDNTKCEILYEAARSNDWKKAYKEVFKKDPVKNSEYLTARVTDNRDTALHVAVETESFKFGEKLIKYMKGEDLAAKNTDGNTAFFLVAASKNVRLVKQMLEKNKKLPSIRGANEMLPINIAAQSGHEEVVRFLCENFLSISKEDQYLNEDDRLKLIPSLIRTGIYDFALKLLKEKPEMATHREESNQETALHILSRQSNFSDKNGSGSFMVRYEKYHLVKWLWKQIRLLNLDKDEISEIIDHPWPVIFDAVEQQNIDFLYILISEFPELTSRVNENKYSIFHVAVLNRQKEIFELIHRIESKLKQSILEKEDDEKNNILHLAGKMPPQEWLNDVLKQERLNNALGIALQWQQELSWFKEVKKIVGPMDVKAKNKAGNTPKDLLDKKIKELKDTGEKWMKEIANSCMIVATLITTVAFAAAFTVPGGTKDDTGTPHFIQKVSFIIFLISDAIALASSSWSILTILSIYTTRYTDEDFVVLPRNVVFGLSTLFLSIAAVMVVFCATIFIVFKDGKIWVPTLASIIASLPVISFTKQHLQLFYGVARLTFENSFLSKTIEKWQDSACWNFLEDCWYAFFYYFGGCYHMFIYYCWYIPFNFCRECCNRLLSCCRDMCSKDM